MLATQYVEDVYKRQLAASQLLLAAALPCGARRLHARLSYPGCLQYKIDVNQPGRQQREVAPPCTEGVSGKYYHIEDP